MIKRGNGTDLGRLLSGRLQLRLCHVVAVCQAIDLYPLEFCRMAFGESKQRSPYLQRLDGVVGVLRG